MMPWGESRSSPCFPLPPPPGDPWGGLKRIAYFKRFRMEVELAALPPVPDLPAGYSWVPWNETLRAVHAEVLYRSFQDEIDATVFPSLGSGQGCQYLMEEISHKAGFLPQGTWLLTGPPDDGAGQEGPASCGTVQGVSDRNGLGAIQNLGITPPHRGRGLGGALLLQALHGFQAAGLTRAFLEVTARNEAALRLYHRLGFRRRKTVYKAVETTFAF